MTERRVTRIIQIGDGQIGGNATISVQSMTKTDTRDVQSTVRQIKETIIKRKFFLFVLDSKYIAVIKTNATS